MTILDQIDRATLGLCPCGAPPADGSAYCSDDCRPTHISDDTDQRESGHLRVRDSSFTLTEEMREQIRDRYAECGQRAAEAIAAFAEVMRPVMRQFGEAVSAFTRSFAAARPADPEPGNLMERALEARRNRNTGPPADRLDGRRRRK